MAKISRLAGSTGHILTVFVQDSSSSTGAGLTGLVNNSVGLTCYYKRNRGTASVAVTISFVTTLGTYVSGGFKEIDAANLPGFYEFHAPDAAMASGSGSVAFLLKGAANMVPCPVEIELTGTDNQDAVRFGMTGVPPMVSGLVVAGSTGSSVIVSGLPAGKSFIGQRLYHAPSGEARTIASQSYSSPNYTLGFTGTSGTEAGPFSSVTAGDVVCPAP